MARFERREQEMPSYLLEWEGKRVRWYEPPHHRAGLVLEAARHLVDHHQQVRLRIARDDGYIAIGIDAEQCTREGHS